ncbi:hypothetical protein F4777DRAFT_235422 [Nemania sp. FL0916]|nr:hypothetical protein F4777DRAFT_235422 [Nemania sp. FL0916]
MSTISSAPREKRYGKKVVYLEPPVDGAVTVKRRVTTIVPPPQPPPHFGASVVMAQPRPAPSIIHSRPPLSLHSSSASIPEHGIYEPESPIDIISVDVDPSETGSMKSSRTSNSYKSSRSSKRHGHSRDSRDREVFIERERLVPVRSTAPYTVQVEPQYDTYRYVEAPRRYEPRRNPDHDIIIEDRRRRRHIRQ